MRRIIWCLAGLVFGYIAGALLGGGLVALLSQDDQFIGTAELLTGPLGAIVGAVAGWIATDTTKKKTKYDIRRKR